MDIFTYKGYLGSFEYDDEAEMYFGEVIELDDMITFEGETMEKLEKAFRYSVDDYLKWCKELEENPECSSIFMHPALRDKKWDIDNE